MVRYFLAVIVLFAVAPGLSFADARPLYYERAITAADLEGRTLRELALLRNTIYARAGHPFRKQWLADHFAAQSWYKPLAKDDESKITALDRANAKVIAKAEQELDRKELESARNKLLARVRDGKAAPEDEIELHLLSGRLGEWVGATKDAPPPSDASPLEDPRQLDRLLTLQQLENLSRRDLRILRNAVYARHGRPFKSELLSDYFASMSWYQLDDGYSDKKLSKMDRKNIQLVKSVENSLGGPLSEHDQKDEEGWFSQS